MVTEGFGFAIKDLFKCTARHLKLLERIEMHQWSVEGDPFRQKKKLLCITFQTFTRAFDTDLWCRTQKNRHCGRYWNLKLTKSSQTQTPWNSIICPGTAAGKHTWLRSQSLTKSVDRTGILLFWLENSAALPLWLVPVTSATIGGFLVGVVAAVALDSLMLDFNHNSRLRRTRTHVFLLNRLLVYSPSILGLGVPATALTVFSCDLEPAGKEHKYACKD